MKPTTRPTRPTRPAATHLTAFLGLSLEYRLEGSEQVDEVCSLQHQAVHVANPDDVGRPRLVLKEGALAEKFRLPEAHDLPLFAGAGHIARAPHLHVCVCCASVSVRTDFRTLIIMIMKRSGTHSSTYNKQNCCCAVRTYDVHVVAILSSHLITPWRVRVLIPG